MHEDSRHFSREFLQVVGEWAEGVPESAWNPGAPPESIDPAEYVAARTFTGRVLLGSLYNFTKRRKRIEGETRFGEILGWVPVGRIVQNNGEKSPGLLEDRNGKPTLLGEAIGLLNQAQTDRRLAQVTGIASYYEETDLFLSRVRKLDVAEKKVGVARVAPVSSSEPDPVSRVLVNIEERIIRLRASQDRLNSIGSKGPAAAAARAVSELASLREEIQNELCLV